MTEKSDIPPRPRRLHDSDLRRYATAEADENTYAWHCLNLLDRIERPRYQIFVDTKEIWVEMNRTGGILDNGWANVRLGGKCLTPDGEVRPVTDVEEKEMWRRADDYSASK